MTRKEEDREGREGRGREERRGGGEGGRRKRGRGERGKERVREREKRERVKRKKAYPFLPPVGEKTIWPETPSKVVVMIPSYNSFFFTSLNAFPFFINCIIVD